MNPNETRDSTPPTTAPTGVEVGKLTFDDPSSLEGTPGTTAFPAELPTRTQHFKLLHYNRSALIVTVLALLVILGAGFGTLALSGYHSNGQSTAKKASDSYKSQNLSVSNLSDDESKQISQANKLSINGQLQVDSTLVIAPGATPTTPIVGQLYFDKASGTLRYYNGSTFVTLGQQNTVTTLGGITGDVALSGDFLLNGNQLSLAPSAKPSTVGVSSFQGQQGAVTLTQGSGISISGTTISNGGVLSIAGGNGLIVSGPSGNVTVTLPQALDTSSTPTFAGLQLSSALGVAQGGTGLTTVASDQILLGGAGNTITQLANTAAGQCLVSNGVNAAPTFQACSGAGGVSSVNGQNSAVTIANATGAAGTITIDNAKADGSTKGIAAFNSTNFSDASGVINTAQNINSTATPTFGGLTLSTALTVGNGGTGSTTAAGARTNLGAAASGANSDITSLGGLTTALSVSQGGTGLASVTANQILIGGASNTISQLANGSSGQCLISNGAGSAPTFQTCTGAGGVSSVDSLNGNITLANSSGAGSTITIDNAKADDSTKGIAAFNSTNFSAASGVINTIQGIATSSTPTFAGLTLSSALTVGNGGTGSTTAAGARTNLGAAASGANGDITSLTGLTTALSVSQGGTGLTTITANQLLIGAASNTVSQVTNGSSGQCLISNGAGSAPSFQTCTGAGGVSSVDSLSGALTLANSSGAGSTITIDNAAADGTTKGIASFVSSNFSASSGVISIKSGGVTTTEILDGTITASDIANTTITGGKIASTTVANSNLVNSALTVTAGSGLTGGGSISLGGSGSLSVVYGSAAGSAVQGNVSLTCSAGTGNLTGGGNSITLGTGGSCSAIDITSSPIFAGTVDVQGSGGLTVGKNSVAGVINISDGAVSKHVASISVGTLASDQSYALPTTGGTICVLEAGNCTGANGGGVTGSGTTSQNYVPKFSNAGGTTITNSSIYNDATGVSIGGNSPASLFNVGTTNQFQVSTAGAVTAVGVNAGTGLIQGTGGLTIGGTTTFSSLTSGGGQCLTTNGTGVLSLVNCLSGSGGGGGGVVALNGLSGTLSLANATGSGATVTIDNAKADGSTKGIAAFNAINFTDASGVINTVQNINSTATPTFGGLTLSSALTVGNGGTGATSASGARTNLGAAASGANSDITSLSGLTTALSISQGGTGLTSVSAYQLLVGSAGGAITQVAVGSSGQCLESNGAGSAPTFQTCTGAGGVSSLDSLTGAITLANSSGSGATVTINDAKADGTTKGIATFNGTDFSASGGIIDTIQGIATTSTPTFAALNLTSALSVGNGGTGATTAAGARTSLGAAASGANSDITSLSGLTTALSVGQGGTGSTTAAGARTSLGAAASGANSDITSLTGLTTALSVSQGGTGLTTITANQILLGGASNTITQLSNGSSGQCLVSNGGGSAPSFQTCTGAGGVSSVNSLTGAITLANSSTGGSTITINDAKADGSTKGIAAFNSTNFTDASGVINLTQNINSSAAPTFGGLTLTGAAGVTSLTASGQITSTVSTGTAPFVVGSTTAVTNLNADLLDGLDSTAFAAATGSNNYIQNGTSPQSNANFNIAASTAVSANQATYSLTNTNTSATTSVANAQIINLTGTTNSSGTNMNVGVRFSTVTPLTGNSFYGISFGTGYTDILRYNSTSLINGSGLLQNVALDSTLNYSNLQKVTNLTASGNVDIQGTTKVALSGTTGTTMVCQNASSFLSSCDATYLAPSATNFIRNQNASAQSTATYWISGTGRADTSVLSPLFDTATGVQLGVGTGTASSVLIGGTTNTFNTTVQANLIVGNGNAGSTGALQVKNNGTATVLNVDTTNSRVGINLASGEAASADLSFGYTAGTRTINLNTPSAGNTAGGNLTVSSGASTGNQSGGTLRLQAGAGGSTGVGGSALVQGGNGGNGASGDGGTATVQGGTALATANGGGAYVKGGSASAGTSSGGGVFLVGANGGNTGSGGVVQINAGSATGGGAQTGGAISITAGANSAGGSGAAGALTLQGGTSVNSSAAGGAIGLTGGTGNSAQAGGAVTLQGGTGGATGAGGVLTLKSGNSGVTSGTAGVVTIDTGTSASGTSQIFIGNTSAGQINIGRTGITTAVTGTLTASNGLQADSIDGLTAGGTLSLGTTNATAGISLKQATTATAGLTLTNAGSIAYQKTASDFTTVGTSNNVNLGTGSLARINGASAQVITGVSGGVDGRILTIVNAGGQTATIKDDDAGSTAGNRIYTGLGLDFSLLQDMTTTLIYDATASHWRVISAPVGVTKVANISATPNAKGGTVSGPSLILTPADGTNGGVVTASAQTFGGDKTFTGATSINYAGTASAFSISTSANPSGSNALIFANNAAGTPTGSLITLQKSGVTKFSVDVNGNVVAASTACIGTTGCTNTLGVAGSIGASGSITASTTPDIAEYIPAASDVTAADVVMADPNNTERVIKASGPYNGAAVGVISDGTSSFKINPYGNVTGAPIRTDIQPLVLAGRVPVKITGENGPVVPGDYLTVSSTPGYAMKATKAGATIGKSLGFFNGVTSSDLGSVLALVNVSYANPSPSSTTLQGAGLSVSGNASFGSNMSVTNDLSVGGITTISTLHVTGAATFDSTVTVAGTLKVADIVVSGHIITSGTAPTSALNSAFNSAGVNVAVNGNDTTGTVTITTSGSQALFNDPNWPNSVDMSNGVSLLQVKFDKQFGATARVLLSPANASAARLGAFTNGESTSSFQIYANSMLSAGKTYTFTYWVAQ